MTVAETAGYAEYLLEVEFVDESGTFSKICGLTGVSTNRSSNVTTTEVPHCDDETLPHSVKRDVRSIEVTVSATGVWAATSGPRLLEWFYSAEKLNARIRNVKTENDGAVGDIFVETAPCILASITDERPDDKGVIRASIELQFDGTPARGVKVP